MESDLNAKIEALRATIQQLDGVPDAQRQHLAESLDELERAAAAEGESHLAPLEQLEESMLELEARHPDATQLLKSIADALGRIGL
jgi:DNA repair exonuclease SbcCD ATPase subunit